MKFDSHAARKAGTDSSTTEWKTLCTLHEVPLVTIEIRKKYGAVVWTLDSMPIDKQRAAARQTHVILGELMTIHAKYQNKKSSCTLSANGGTFFDLDRQSCDALAEEVFNYLIAATSINSLSVH